AIGPAGTDLHGPWGIHVGEQADGAAQPIKHALEEAARRLAGSRGNPPRLLDESATFDREPTGHWAPGAPRVLPHSADVRPPAVGFGGRVAAARVPQAAPATFVAQAAPVQVAPPSNPDLRNTPLPRARGGRTRPPPLSVRTALGYASGSGAQSAIVRLGL